MALRNTGYLIPQNSDISPAWLKLDNVKIEGYFDAVKICAKFHAYDSTARKKTASQWHLC